MRAAIFRLMVVLWAVASAALPGALAVAHARDAAADMAPARGHVEAESDEGCLPVHGAECALCTWHRWGGGVPATAATAFARTGPTRPGPVCGPSVLSSADAGRQFQPRAPPTV